MQQTSRSVSDIIVSDFVCYCVHCWCLILVRVCKHAWKVRWERRIWCTVEMLSNFHFCLLYYLILFLHSQHFSFCLCISLFFSFWLCCHSKFSYLWFIYLFIITTITIYIFLCLSDLFYIFLAPVCCLSVRQMAGNFSGCYSASIYIYPSLFLLSQIILLSPSGEFILIMQPFSPGSMQILLSSEMTTLSQLQNIGHE